MGIEHTEDNSGNAKDSSEGSTGCGCLFGIVLVSAILYFGVSKEDFYVMPGDTNNWSGAMEYMFENIYPAIPDTLKLEDDLNVYAHYNRAESIENKFYILTPSLRVRSNTGREYQMVMYAGIHHTGPDEYKILRMEVLELIAFDQDSASVDSFIK